MEKPPQYTVEIGQSGRGGTIVYREGAHEAVLDWEFGGGNAVALIWLRGSAAGAVARAGGRDVLLRRVADEVVRRQAPSCRAEIEEESGTIVIRSGGGKRG